ncbi:sigma-E processing peptidase SpoIIGA [Jeotgalibacillus aurantiacus]|uniref:sigma-E processing peptidase SpoIIGA n=1 Tax=Jeotgalibacillus aurantiacus TaxID=2763266 RepID=UPI001D0B2C23|nr:sigma-E processing peptidase SpoIIGA [Jeotgalibacillus aurantiacus]
MNGGISLTLHFESLLLLNLIASYMVILTASLIHRQKIHWKMWTWLSIAITILQAVLISLDFNERIFVMSGIVLSITIISLFSRKKSRLLFKSATLLFCTFISGSLSIYFSSLFYEVTNYSLFLHPFIYLLVIMLIFLFVFCSVRYASAQITHQSVCQSYTYKVSIKNGNQQWSGSGYLDSGNCLSAPFSMKPVIFASGQVARQLFSEDSASFLLNETKTCPADLLNRIQYIPSRSVHQVNQILTGVTCETIEVFSPNGNFVLYDCPVIFLTENYFVHDTCHCLLNPMQLMSCYQI